MRPGEACSRNEEASADPANGAKFLADLRQAHSEQIEALKALPLYAQATTPNLIQYNTTRFRVRRANLARRALMQRICEYLNSRVSPSERIALQEVMRRDAEMLQDSSKHVAHWKSERFAEEWEDYRVAAQQFRFRILKVLEDQRRTLYPMLERIEGGG